MEHITVDTAIIEPNSEQLAIVNSAYRIGLIFKLPVVLSKAFCTFIRITVRPVLMRFKTTFIKIDNWLVIKLKLRKLFKKY